MDIQNRHPFNAIAGYENLSMLEALIPFVEYPLKLPLALFIKFSEIRLIINCFQSANNLTRLGLHNPSNSPLDMICSLTGMSPDLMKMMFSMMEGGDNSTFSDLFNNMSTSDNNSNQSNPLGGFSAEDLSNAMNMFQAMQSGTSNTFQTAEPNHTSDNENPPHNDEHCHTTSSDSFEESIQSILAEYDLAQATEFDQDTQNNNLF